MIKNNIKSLIFYIFIIIVTFFLLRGLMILENNTDLSMNNLIIKSIILILYIFLFFVFGKLLGNKTNFFVDYFSFLLSFILIIMFYTLGILAGGINIEEISNIATLPFFIFSSPLILFITILGLKINLLTLGILSGYISLIIGFGIQFNKKSSL